MGAEAGGGWRTDYPDSDLNFLAAAYSNSPPSRSILIRSFLDLTDESLADYPFLYMIEPGGLSFSEDEVTLLYGSTASMAVF